MAKKINKISSAWQSCTNIVCPQGTNIIVQFHFPNTKTNVKLFISDLILYIVSADVQGVYVLPLEYMQWQKGLYLGKDGHWMLIIWFKHILLNNKWIVNNISVVKDLTLKSRSRSHSVVAGGNIKEQG